MDKNTVLCKCALLILEYEYSANFYEKENLKPMVEIRNNSIETIKRLAIEVGITKQELEKEIEKIRGQIYG